MSGYRKRAPFYRSEFAVRDDFPLLLLTVGEGLVVDIPSGAGRLLPVHRAHGREVIMVDIEPAMVEQCRIASASCGLAQRVSMMQGDITTWRAPVPAARVVVAWGGLQMLSSQEAVAQAVTVSAANLAGGGVLYLDIAMPWTTTAATAHHLAPFLRFTGTTRLEGSTCIQAGDMRIRRSYTSTLLPDRVAVHFRYEADGKATGDWQDFEADASWRKVDVASVLGTLKKNNLTVTSVLGDYAGTPYTTGSARFICVAAAL
ncbi:MAG TPA: class I SAM-dependent methyltransferase [Streptosporangiaceae bacterium]|nr:class I SAM-dependent methyltransferase [Streptosporangiaceae bacterium]